ncbi:g6014 [Coccomyxa viridis]|uniref:G6014 protein n=1 Tax=Coccomyxa viridis TaxID=1274662 RepID=A0ABP1FWX9_9CHLO
MAEGMEGPWATFDALPVDLIQRIAAMIPDSSDPVTQRTKHRLHLVSRRFNEALREPCDVWQNLTLHAKQISKCQPWFVNWLRPRATAVQTLDATFSSDDAHRLELLLSLLGRTLKELTLRSDQTDLVFGCSHISQPVLQHLACCPQLRQLNITSAELMAVDLSALSYLTALEDMSLTSKYDHTHHSLPEPLLGLASLRILSVRFPSLTSLQNGISRLTMLETLRIEGLQGTLVVEPGVGRLGALKSLMFKNCSWLGDIGPNRPPWCPALTGLTSLTELVFDHCPMLNTLPDAVCDVTSLERLSLSTGAGAWGGDHARRRSMDLQVPNNLGKLTNLRTLAIGHKLVKAIPEPVLQLTGLEELAITYCKLQRLPSNLAAMHRLRCLNLQGNPWLQIQDSDDWDSMTCLQSLTLSDISNLSPKSSFLAITRLPSLRHVSLKGSMPVDSLSFKTLMQLSHTLGARGIPVEA